MTCLTRKKTSNNNNYIINNVSDLSSGTGIQTMTETQPLTLKMKHPFQCSAATCIHWHGCRMGFFFNNVFTLVCFRGPKKMGFNGRETIFLQAILVCRIVLLSFIYHTIFSSCIQVNTVPTCPDCRTFIAM